MRHTIRFIILFFALVIAGAGNVRAVDITSNDIIINVLPNNAAGTVTVTNIQNPDPTTDTEVTITVTPASGYSIDRSHIFAEKMVDAMAPRRAPGMSAGLNVSGTNPFSFTIPAGYTGAYVTVNFYKTTANGITSLDDIPNTPEGLAGTYVLTADVNAAGFSSLGNFTGTLDGGYHKIYNLSEPLFTSTSGSAIIRNITFEDINITVDADWVSNHNAAAGDAGAVTANAGGSTRIYNCGILPSSTERDNDGNITGFSGSTVSGTGNVGGLVGTLSGNARVINCYSYANIIGGTTVAGIVGNNTTIAIDQDNVGTEGMVVNCMFYGDITGSSTVYPVYGGTMINNAGDKAVNTYCYYRKNAQFDNNYQDIDNYNRSWPAEEKNLTRFEYYRSILNSNKKLCTWWVNGTNATAPSDDDIESVGIAKWVLDPAIAPYPILKKWGKYPSVINQDPDKRFDSSSKTWVNRDNASDHWGKDMAPDTEGQKLGSVTVTINAGNYHSGSDSRTIPITAMDIDINDYCYGKIQLPYYNEIFGNPDGETWETKYGGNYTAHVVTGWVVSGGNTATDYNYADRNSYAGRVFAQGGYFYVPKDVTSITITAQWADAVYLCNKDYSLDRVNVANGEKKNQNDNSANAPKKIPEFGSSFTPAGTLPTTFQGRTVYTTIKDAIGALSKTSSGKDVYNQAIVLIGNVQLRNHSSVYGATGTNTRPFTLMSADLDFDNEPDNCLELQFRNDIDRPGVQPIRFDFLPVPDLGLAIRTNNLAYAIGIMIPLGHFEITETAFMRTTQFEYDAAFTRTGKSPVIINGGEHEMFTKRKQLSDATQRDRTSYFLLGGNAWIHRFAPGAHPNTGDKPDIYLFPVNVIGGQVKELYLTGLYRPELPVSGTTIGGAPRCYVDGGKFDIMAGAGYDKVKSGEDVIFEINHSRIGEFYGGGINASNPISGDIEVTINNSLVDKYCGGPKVGNMAGHKVTTKATGTTFGVFYGGGNGGNSYYRQLQDDGDWDSPTTTTEIGSTYWNNRNYKWNSFNPLGVKDDGTDNKGYHAEYEFEVFNQSNGLTDQITQRGFIKWIQFGITTTGDVESTLEDCKVLGNFYGGGNLASVTGKVTSTLKGNTIIEGSAFGAGFSAAIPTFQVHNKNARTFPSLDKAGTVIEGSIPYDPIVYEWTNKKLAGKDEAYMKANPTYQDNDNGKWYCYTWNSLANLGTVTSDVSLTIKGTTEVKGSVFGGGAQSAVSGDTNVYLQEDAQVDGDVFGGGDQGEVGGNATVDVMYTEPTETPTP